MFLAEMDQFYSFVHFTYFNGSIGNQASDRREFATIVYCNRDESVHVMDMKVKSTQFKNLLHRIAADISKETKMLLAMIQLTDEDDVSLPELSGFHFYLFVDSLNRPFDVKECLNKDSYQIMELQHG